MRRINTYIPTSRNLKHLKETITLLSKLTDDQSYIEEYNELSKKGQVNTMCEVTEYYLSKGKIEILSNLIKQGIITITIAAEQLNLSEEEFIQKQEEYDKQIH